MCLMLVVDDDELVRVSVAAILATMGHDIIFARDGLDAVAIYKIKHHEINLVLMDIIMPKMDGIAATRAIKNAHPTAKVILMSGYTDHISPIEADAFLPKPFRSKTLCHMVEQILMPDLYSSLMLLQYIQ